MRMRFRYRLYFLGVVAVLLLLIYTCRLKTLNAVAHIAPGLTGFVNGTTCTKQLHFHFTKVEKTGSSTLASILSRFVLEHGTQNVMVMTVGGHIDITKCQGQVPGWDIGPRHGDKAEVLVDHARFNETFITEHFTPHLPLITSVREPVFWYLSAAEFFHKPVFSTLHSNGIYEPRTTRSDEFHGIRTFFHLSQLQWLGFDYKQRDDLGAIKRYINYIVDKFDIIYLTDQFDASLIIMRRRFCWDHGDILYKSHEVHGHHQSLATPERTRLLSPEVNLGEQLLYEAFNRSWWAQPEVKDSDFIEEVAYFKKVNMIQTKKCKEILSRGADLTSFTIEASKWSAAVTLTFEKCDLITHNKYPLMGKLSHYALGYKYYLYKFHFQLSRMFTWT